MGAHSAAIQSLASALAIAGNSEPVQFERYSKMKHALISALVLATLPMTAAYAGKSGAPNQSQPTSSVVTTSAAAAAFANALSTGAVTVTSVSQSAGGGPQVTFSAGGISGTAQLSPGGQVVVTFSDGSTTSFSISDL